MTTQLLEDALPMKLSLEESKSGKLVARGEFARCDVPTANGRVYPRALYEREIKKLQASVKARSAFGELDHPSDGKTKLQRASHIITDLDIDKNGTVRGVAEILDTPNGRTLKAIIDAGAEVGVSSRGFGSTSVNRAGNQVVGEDFKLKSFDFVADPAMKSAVPQYFSEDVDIEIEPIDLFREDYPDVYSAIEESLKGKAQVKVDKSIDDLVAKAEYEVEARLTEQFERNLAEQLIAIKDSVQHEVQESYESDPLLGGAKGVLSEIASMVSEFNATGDERALRDALKARDLELHQESMEREKFASLAKRLGYSLYVERRITGHPMPDTIRTAIGDTAQYDSLESVSSALSKVLEELDEAATSVEESRRGVVEAEVAKVYAEELEAVKVELEAERADNAQLRESEEDNQRSYLEVHREMGKFRELAESMKSELDKADTALEEAEAELKKHRAEAYRLKKSRGYTNSGQLVTMLEGVEDEGSIDRIVQESGRRSMMDSELENMRRRIRRGTVNSGPDALTEAAAGRSTALGDISLAEVRMLAGLDK